MEKELISVSYDSHIIIADILPNGSTPKIFCMHGAGISNRKIFDPFRQLLLENNISSCALDFIGYGNTGGIVEESSLKSRTNQAELIIEKTKMIKPLVIIGGSMGGYNAIKLTEIYPTELLVLSAPAVYRKDVYGIPFGDKFSSLIREPNSWENTDAWEILNKYKGKILILSAMDDKVIPSEIIQKIYDNSQNAEYREILTIPNAPHRLISYLGEHREDLKIVVDKIISLLD